MPSSRKEDLQHLDLLSLFHYILGALIAVGSLFPLVYLFMGIAFVAMPTRGPQGPPAAIGWFFILLSIGLMVLIWAYAACVLTAGWFLSRRKHYTFCLVVAGMLCLLVPKGTILGVFTFIVLFRPSVKELFERGGTREEGEVLPEVEEALPVRRPRSDVRVYDRDS
jgi:hypothetical protein